MAIEMREIRLPRLRHCLCFLFMLQYCGLSMGYFKPPSSKCKVSPRQQLALAVIYGAMFY